MTAGLRIAVFAVVLSAAFAPRAYGQLENRLAVGVSASGHVAESSKTDGAILTGLQWRFGHDKGGWGWQYSLNWFETGVNQPIADHRADIGRLHVRPLMGGYGYTWSRGRAAISSSLVAGYAFASFKLDPAAADDYRARLGARNVTTEAGNTLAINPEVHAWYDFSKRVGLKVSTGFIVARPSITMKSSLGEDVRHINADTFLLKLGVVYKIF
jgi:hypothetical protein